MKITSSKFVNSGFIPVKYTCDGKDINPPLDIFAVPLKTESLVLLVEDPDAPHGNWVHWVISDISPKISRIEEDSAPKGAVEGRTSFGRPGYGGPCPPAGTHHFIFRLYALDTKLHLSSVEGKEGVEKAMAGHILEQAELVGLYNREE